MENVKKILVVGHPRCGTRYISKLLQSYGLDVEHEKIGKDGTSSWFYTVDDYPPFDTIKQKRSEYIWENMIHCVRDPFKAIPSIAKTETPESPFFFEDKERYSSQQIKNIIKYFNDKGVYDKKEIFNETKKQMSKALSFYFRDKYLNIDKRQSIFEMAAQSYIKWNKLIEQQQPDIRVKIESDEINLKNYLKTNHIIREENTRNSEYIEKNINSREYKKATYNDWKTISDQTISILNNICIKYGYDKISYHLEKEKNIQ